MHDTADADGEGGSEAVPEAEPLTLEERIALALEVGEECIQEEELAALFAGKPTPVCYDGFEPSGRMHIAQVCWFGVCGSMLPHRNNVLWCWSTVVYHAGKWVCWVQGWPIAGGFRWHDTSRRRSGCC